MRTREGGSRGNLAPPPPTPFQAKGKGGIRFFFACKEKPQFAKPPTLETIKKSAAIAGVSAARCRVSAITDLSSTPCYPFVILLLSFCYPFVILGSGPIG